jgi:hypothetical protein
VFPNGSSVDCQSDAGFPQRGVPGGEGNPAAERGRVAERAEAFASGVTASQGLHARGAHAVPVLHRRAGLVGGRRGRVEPPVVRVDPGPDRHAHQVRDARYGRVEPGSPPPT